MSGIFKVFLLLAVMVCITEAQLHPLGEHCLCGSVKKGILSKSALKDIQVYPATTFCNKVEIVVTNNNGFRYCLDPKMSTVKKMLASIL
ncbi:hypothetical protein L3Q82_020630 [Scortum barcoo]|uniref:Uncharacterized protein n=1 Tax=Scortum barcoo TaxID=214431 RepID=A0ACB8V8B6_9TELE|nr:hypothetical protein L3Q82_020630 [Scortum barcoo]